MCVLAVRRPWYFINWVYTIVLQAELKRHERDYMLIQRENVDLSKQVIENYILYLELLIAEKGSYPFFFFNIDILIESMVSFTHIRRPLAIKLDMNFYWVFWITLFSGKLSL